MVRTGKPVIVEDAPSHPLLEDVRASVEARGIVRNIAALPLTGAGQGAGRAAAAPQRRPGAFNPREIEFLTTVAHATAVAFRNVRRLESVRGQREKEKTARIAAEERAAELKRYEAYFDHLSDGIAILDARACVLSLNPAGLAHARRRRRSEARGPPRQRAHQPHRRRAAARRALLGVAAARCAPTSTCTRAPWPAAS